MEPGVGEYLSCTAIIDCDCNSIKEMAHDLTKGQTKIPEKATALFYFVRDEIKYNPYLFTLLTQHLRASTTLKVEKGFCIQKAVLFAALARATGIPARLRFADIKNHFIPRKLVKIMGTDLFIWHGYNELYISGKWLKVSPIIDLKMCRENRIIPVEFDGKKDAVYHSHNQEGKLHIEYITDHGHYHDVPLAKIAEAISDLKLSMPTT